MSRKRSSNLRLMAYVYGGMSALSWYLGTVPEAHDRENPWRPMSTAPRGTGLVCDLLFDDMVGQFATEGLQFFLDAKGHWYQIDPPRRVSYAQPINWRPSYVRMTPERQSLVKKRDTYA